MKMVLSAAAGLLAFAASAALADGPVANRASKDAPVYTSPQSWTGFHVAGGFGYGLWAAETTTVSAVSGACILCVDQTQGGKGALGVVGIGYDIQLQQRFVLGVFADASFANIEGTIQDQTPFFAGTIKEERMYAVGVRFGLLINPSILTYGTAGYANAHFTGANMATTFNGAPTAFSTPDFSRGGWFIGSGVETVLWPGWRWRTEYRFADYGAITLPDTTPAGAAASSIRFQPVEHSVRSELVYKFNWAGR